MVVMSERDNGSEDYSDTSVIAKNHKVKRHPYKVLLLNDDFTPMGWCMFREIFSINHESAVQIMLLFTKRVAVVGIFHEIAETKVTQVMNYSRKINTSSILWKDKLG